MAKTPLRPLAGVAVAAVLMVLAGPVVLAAGSAGAPAIRTVTTFPNGYIEYKLPPSGTVSDSLRVGDDGDAPGTFKLVAVDGFTSSLTGVVYGDATNAVHDGPHGNGEYGAATWITLASPSVSLKPGEQTTVAYTVHVPAGTHAGDYVGAISAENPVPTGAPSSGAGVGLNITQRSVMAVVVHVPGALTPPTFSVGQPTIAVENHRRQVITFPLTYSGDTLIKPHLVFSVVGLDGKQLLHFDQKLDTFVPHTTIRYPFPIDSTTLVPGTYRLTGSFGDGSHDSNVGGSVTVSQQQAAVPPPDQRSGPPPVVPASTPVWVPAVMFGIGGLMLLALAALGVLWWRRTCSHCERHVLRGLIRVDDFHEIAGCPPCRTRALNREDVRLCQRCYRSHVLARQRTMAGGDGRASAGR